MLLSINTDGHLGPEIAKKRRKRQTPTSADFSFTLLVDAYYCRVIRCVACGESDETTCSHSNPVCVARQRLKHVVIFISLSVPTTESVLS